MTENERVLRDIIIDGNGFDYDESIPQSIFEEIQQYRAIGTVEECEKAMDFELAKQDKMLAEVIDDYLKYIKIGTIEEFKDLKEKSVAKKPLPKGTHKGIDNFYCPNCNHPLTNRHEQCELPYCDICGQKLDWSVEE